MIKHKKIMITGGAGFIGQALVNRLKNDNEIVIFDTLTGQDILNYEQLNTMMKGVDIVVHLAAIAGRNIAWRLPRETIEVNTIGTYNVLNAMIENNVKHIVFSSTSEVYGPNNGNAMEDAFLHQGPPNQIRWIYATSKLIGENFLYAYQLKYGIKISTVRYFNVYGEDQDKTGHHGAMIIFIKQALEGVPITIHNDGAQIHTWCHVDDAVDCTLKVMESEKANGEIFNIGNPMTQIAVLDLANKIIELTKSTSTLAFVKMDKPDITLRIPNINKAKSYLGFSPSIGLDEGILRVASWLKNRSSL